MKKTVALSVAIAAIFLGCSKQPNLQNAQEVGANGTQTENISGAGVAGAESVDTTNANVESATIGESTSSTISGKNQVFAKKLSTIVVYFDFDKYNIKPSEMPKVEKLAELIKSNPSNYTVRIEGNCDEWGTEEYNYALGLKRANTVKDALIKLGVDPQKLTVISYGELNPVCTAHAKWCWRLNRRDNFTYLP
ncbi:MAG: OmpA family protein [Epsilonproteobacteria bacterium]|nr:OmpA family protein [Campylobacterota bacterium]